MLLALEAGRGIAMHAKAEQQSSHGVTGLGPGMTNSALANIPHMSAAATAVVRGSYQGMPGNLVGHSGK